MWEQPHKGRNTESSDINIEEKLHIFVTNWISISAETVFRLLLIARDHCLYFLTFLMLTVTDEIHLRVWMD